MPIFSIGSFEELNWCSNFQRSADSLGKFINSNIEFILSVQMNNFCLNIEEIKDVPNLEEQFECLQKLVH